MGGHGRVYSDAGVSESIGFLLIFTIIIAGIGLVTLYGYPMLMKQQVSADEQIMEKNLIVLQNDVKSLAYKTVPYKETSLKIGGGALTVYDMNYDTTKSSEFEIFDSAGCIPNSAGDAATLGAPLIFSSGDIRYASTSAQTDISLENGAVVMRKLAQPGSVMLAEPRWFYDGTTNTAVIYLIGFNTTNIMSSTGVRTVQMALGESNYTSCPQPTTVYIRYQPNSDVDYSTAWNTYFDNTLGMKPDSLGYYTFPSPSGKTNLVIKTYEIRITSL
ncbi:hypothetical protein [Methanoregula sp.]|jgi:hypothetical protein|uniref:DUF7289 family protein n=1 Tax=Methanoregula sp. TaxID=2052170 RepID=UPI003564B478